MNLAVWLALGYGFGFLTGVVLGRLMIRTGRYAVVENPQ